MGVVGCVLSFHAEVYWPRKEKVRKVRSRRGRWSVEKKNKPVENNIFDVKGAIVDLPTSPELRSNVHATLNVVTADIVVNYRLLIRVGYTKWTRSNGDGKEKVQVFA